MPSQSNPKRILLKLSGEMLRGASPFGLDGNACQKLAASLKKIQESHVQLGIVIGGGNIFRGIDLSNGNFPRPPADQIGMLATLMNGIALKQALAALDCPATVMTALPCPSVAESYQWERANHLLQKGEIVIFVGGTGNSHFTTDTAAALRACEINADLLLKATKVDGVYNKDPVKNKDAAKYSSLSYAQVLNEKLGIMDATAIAMCQSNHIPILVFDMSRLASENIAEIISRKGEKGSLIS